MTCHTTTVYGSDDVRDVRDVRDVQDVKDILTLLQDMLPKEIEQVSLGFSPRASFPVMLRNKENHTLFVSDKMKAIFSENTLVFPTLSHA